MKIIIAISFICTLLTITNYVGPTIPFFRLVAKSKHFRFMLIVVLNTVVVVIEFIFIS